MLADYRVATLVTGALLVAVAPVAFIGLPRWKGWPLGLLALCWGLSRMLIVFAGPATDLQTRLMVYAFIGTVASGLLFATCIITSGRLRWALVVTFGAIGVGFMGWFAADHEAFLGGTIPAINIVFPLVLASLASAGLASIVASRRPGGGRIEFLLGLALLMLPAFRGVELGLLLLLQDSWRTPVGITESLLYMATIGFVILGVAHIDRENRNEPLWAVLFVAVAIGALMAVGGPSMPGRSGLFLRYGLDALMATLSAAGILSFAAPKAAGILRWRFAAQGP